MSKLMELVKANYKTILSVHAGAAVSGNLVSYRCYSNSYRKSGQTTYHISNRDRLFGIIGGGLIGIAMLYSIPLIMPISLLIVLDEIQDNIK